MKTSNTSKITQQACEWVAKLHEAELSEKEDQELRAWLAESAEHKTEMRRVADQWEQLNSLTMLAVPPSQQKSKSEDDASSFSFTRAGLSFATLVIIAVAAIWLSGAGLWSQGSIEQDIAQEVRPYSTDIGEQRLIVLPDSSTVLLNTNSQFSVAYTPEYRDIYLIQGEAHFEVQSSSDRPFRVFAGKSQVRAVGTAFSVYLKKQTVDITVTHGSVSIDSIREAITDSSSSVADEIEEQLIVNAGYAAEFNQLVGSVETKALPDESVIPAWHHGKLKFSGEPLNQFVEEISRYSPLSIVILDSELRDLRIGGLFDVGETDKMFEALESGFGIKVDYINERLVHLTAVKPKKTQL